MSSRHDFLNRIRSLFNIDRHMLPELSQGEFFAFQGNPVNYFMRCNDTQADAIWREVEKRQPGASA